jgi:DNA/RNA endonuclease YhcR with UshA esterase domain
MTTPTKDAVLGGVDHAGTMEATTHHKDAVVVGCAAGTMPINMTPPPTLVAVAKTKKKTPKRVGTNKEKTGGADKKSTKKKKKMTHNKTSKQAAVPLKQADDVTGTGALSSRKAKEVLLVTKPAAMVRPGIAVNSTGASSLRKDQEQVAVEETLANVKPGTAVNSTGASLLRKDEEQVAVSKTLPNVKQVEVAQKLAVNKQGAVVHGNVQPLAAPILGCPSHKTKIVNLITEANNVQYYFKLDRFLVGSKCAGDNCTWPPQDDLDLQKRQSRREVHYCSMCKTESEGEDTKTTTCYFLCGICFQKGIGKMGRQRKKTSKAQD